jgi:hypothetical protein
MKRITGLFLCLLIALSVVVFPTTASALDATSVTIMQYKDKNLTFKKAETDEYNCSVTNNKDGYIKVSANNEGEYYWLMVYAKKATKTTKPVITITDSKSGKEIKKYKVTVSAAKKVKQSNVKINKGTWKYVYVKDPYNNEPKLSYNKKIVKFNLGYLGDGSSYRYEVKGLKKGTTTVKVKLKGTSTVIGSFKIKVGDFKATIKKSYKNAKLRYNKHIKSCYLETGGTVNVAEAINNFHANGKYTVKIKNPKVAKTIKAEKTKTTPKCVEIYALKTGKTKADVYEKRGKSKKKKIGTINITVKQAKDAEVYGANRALDNDGIFYEFFVNVGDKIDLKSIVVRSYINSAITGSRFKESEYKFTFTATPAEVVTVDQETGVFTIHSNDSHHVGYEITFADGSKASGGGSFCIESTEFM